MEEQPTAKKKWLNLYVIISIVILCAALFLGTKYLKSGMVTIVQEKYENGQEKEVWIYEQPMFGKRKKIKEVSYFSDGIKESERDYKNGKVNGWARMWFKDGQLYMEATYIDNKVHGVRTAYHENGQMFCRAEYEHGKILRKKNWDKEGKEIYLPLDRE